MTDLLTLENLAWLEHFQVNLQRRPRVLLVGNIANNAYNDAKILNQAGLDCDVICYDYYHVMASPEWEDADLAGSPADDFRPDWTKVDTGGFMRPRWFAQGPLRTCIDYLIAKRTDDPQQDALWRELEIFSLVARPSTVGERMVSVWSHVLAIAAPYKTQVLSQVKRNAPKLYNRMKSIKRALQRVRHYNKSSCSDRAPASESEFAHNSLKLMQRFMLEFPGRSDRLTHEDVKDFSLFFDQWSKLFKLYDIIIGFSTDPFLPALSGVPYFAMEHGTLREIPFQSDPQGRRTALAYRLAAHCFVTNFDCAENAAKLAPGRNTLINHPYDEDHGLSVGGGEELRSQLKQELDSDFLFFHPTRQDWVEGTGYADKSNDIFLRAMAALRKRGLRVGLVLCSWGANVTQSRRLIRELGCDPYVRWTRPLAITPFERMCIACDVVVDQFKLGAFGGVVFKAMAVGTPIITFLNEELIIRQYPELPPVINCKTAIDIESAVVELMQQPQRKLLLGEKSREWICRHHGKRETINRQVDRFRSHLPIPSGSNIAVAP